MEHMEIDGQKMYNEKFGKSGAQSRVDVRPQGTVKVGHRPSSVGHDWKRTVRPLGHVDNTEGDRYGFFC